MTTARVVVAARAFRRAYNHMQYIAHGSGPAATVPSREKTRLIALGLIALGAIAATSTDRERRSDAHINTPYTMEHTTL